MKRLQNAALVVFLVGLLVAALLLVVVGWEIALVVFVVAVVISIYLTHRANARFRQNPFGEMFGSGDDTPRED